jgi:hypothetical protein
MTSGRTQEFLLLHYCVGYDIQESSFFLSIAKKERYFSIHHILHNNEVTEIELP